MIDIFRNFMMKSSQFYFLFTPQRSPETYRRMEIIILKKLISLKEHKQ